MEIIYNFSAKRSPEVKRSWTLTCLYYNILHIRVFIYHKDHIMMVIIANLFNCRFAFALYLQQSLILIFFFFWRGTCIIFMHVYILFLCKWLNVLNRSSWRKNRGVDNLNSSNHATLDRNLSNDHSKCLPGQDL